MDPTTSALILAAGKGSRVKGYDGNKTLLPLVPGSSPFEGSHSILSHILDNLPAGPKALVVNHKKEDVVESSRTFGLTYCEQPRLNGTGGALLSAREFLEKAAGDRLIITMGDVPFVKEKTYRRLVTALGDQSLVILGFRPENKKQYGVLEMDGKMVKRIIEWKYWRSFPSEKRNALEICNSGIYATRQVDLLRSLSVLEKMPHTVQKTRDGKMVPIEEYFITDLVEVMVRDGLKVGHILADDENEVMGIDDLPSLRRAQELFRECESE